MYWILLAIILVVVTWTFFNKLRKWHKLRNYWQKRKFSFCDTSKLESLGEHTSNLPRHEFEFLLYEAVKKNGIRNYVGVMEGSIPALYVVDPDLIKHIMVKDFDCFVDRRVPNVGKSDPVLTTMLTNAKGQNWKDLRSTLTPAFSSGKIRRMFAIFEDSASKMSQFITRQLPKNGGELEIRGVMTRFAIDVITSTAFGLDSSSFSDEESEFGKYIKKFHAQSSGKRPWLTTKARQIFPQLFEFLRIPITDQEALQFFGKVIADAIKHRQDRHENRDDILQLLLEAQNSAETSTQRETSDRLSHFEQEQEIKSSHSKMHLTADLLLAQSILFFFAGSTTVESQLVMAIYELSLQPEIQERLYKEVRNAAVANSGKLPYDVVVNLEYLDQVVSETLRKWPNSLRLERMSTKPFRIPNTELLIEKDTLVIVPQYGIQRDERHYPDSDKFDPERFNAQNKGKITPYTYLPFGVGPRSCIATRFGICETKVALAQLVLNFQLKPSTTTKIPSPLEAPHFKPLGSFWLHLSPRG